MEEFRLFTCTIHEKIWNEIQEDIRAWKWNEMDERSIDHHRERCQEFGLNPAEASFLYKLTRDKWDIAAEIIDKTSDAECLLSDVEWIRECKRFLIRRKNGSLENNERHGPD